MRIGLKSFRYIKEVTDGNRYIITPTDPPPPGTLSEHEPITDKREIHSSVPGYTRKLQTPAVLRERLLSLGHCSRG